MFLLLAIILVERWNGCSVPFFSGEGDGYVKYVCLDGFVGLYRANGWSYSSAKPPMTQWYSHCWSYFRSVNIHSGKRTSPREKTPCWWYLPGKMVIFHGYVSSPEVNLHFHFFVFVPKNLGQLVGKSSMDFFHMTSCVVIHFAIEVRHWTW